MMTAWLAEWSDGTSVRFVCSSNPPLGGDISGGLMFLYEETDLVPETDSNFPDGTLDLITCCPESWLGG